MTASVLEAWKKENPGKENEEAALPGNKISYFRKETTVKREGGV